MGGIDISLKDRYTLFMSLEEIKEAMPQLSATELAEFMAWFEEFKPTNLPRTENSLRSFGLSADEFTVSDNFDAPLSKK